MQGEQREQSQEYQTEFGIVKEPFSLKEETNLWRGKLRQWLKKEKQESEINVNIEFFYGIHKTKEDVKAFKEKFDKCDIYIPEFPSWTAEWLLALALITAGQIPKKEFETGKKLLSEYGKAEMDMLYKSKKALAVIDVPRDNEVARELERLPKDLHDSLQNKTFQERKEVMKYGLEKYGALQKQREDYMLSNITSAISKLIKNSRYLKSKPAVNVLIYLGAAHIRIYHTLYQWDFQTHRNFQEKPFVFTPMDEIVRRMILGKETSSELWTEATFEHLILTSVLYELSKITSHNNKKTLFIRKIINELASSGRENLERIGNTIIAVQKNLGQRDWHVFFERTNKILKKEGIEFPQTEEELDKIIQWHLYTKMSNNNA